MAQLPSIPKGTRDYSPEIMVKRNYIFDTIKSVFKLYGYMPLETPAMENLSTLMVKYGEEGDKLLFKILNSGDFIGNIPDQELVEKNSIKLTNKISEKGLRYDLTVPFARFVVQHQSELTFPFKRYQIQPVWRADRPQKGRYREFYQCDVDVVGSDSLLHEVELIQMVDEVYRRLKIKVRLLINNRKILAGIAEIIGYPDQLTDITVAIDKMDKIGLTGVVEELTEKGFAKDAVDNFEKFLSEGDFTLESLKSRLEDKTPAESLEHIIDTVNELTGNAFELVFDLSLVRGQGYYTGTVFEVESIDFKGAVAGGGRYDHLIGKFLNEDIPAVGFSIGFERIFGILMNNGISIEQRADKIAVVYEDGQLKDAVKAADALRAQGKIASLYIKPKKLGKFLNKLEERGYDGFLNVGVSEEVSMFEK